MKRNPPQRFESEDVPDYRRDHLNGGTYFFTVVRYKRYPVLKEEAAIDLLRHCCRATAATHPFSVDAIVILPDHVHTTSLLAAS